MIHISGNYLKHVGFLIRLYEEKEFVKSWKVDLLEDILKSLINRKLSYYLLKNFNCIKER